MNERGLIDLKEQIEKAKITNAELQGRLSHLTEELQEKWKSKTIGEAQTKLKQMEKEKELVENQIEVELEEIIKMKGGS